MKRLSLLALTVIAVSLPCLAQDAGEGLPPVDQSSTGGETNPFGSGYGTDSIYSYSTGMPPRDTPDGTNPGVSSDSNMSANNSAADRADSIMPHGPSSQSATTTQTNISTGTSPVPGVDTGASNRIGNTSTGVGY
jgi:hypothetical protein